MKEICPILYKIALEMGTCAFKEKYGGFLCPVEHDSKKEVMPGEVEQIISNSVTGVPEYVFDPNSGIGGW